MKTIVLAAAAALATSGAVYAQDAAYGGQLTDTEKHQIELLVPNAKVDHLSEEQVTQVRAALNSGNDNNAQKIRAALQ